MQLRASGRLWFVLNTTFGDGRNIVATQVTHEDLLIDYKDSNFGNPHRRSKSD